MAYFVVFATDRDGHGAVRAAHRPAHRERLRSNDHPVRVLIGGPTLDAAGAMNGTMLVIEAGALGDVETFMAGDPYVRAGLYGRLEIRPYAWGLGVPSSPAGDGPAGDGPAGDGPAGEGPAAEGPAGERRS
ncbi:MAG: YciI family protein [Hyphomicrobiales bacterium]